LFGLGAFEAHGAFLAIAIHSNAITWQHLAFQNLHRQRILNQSLNGSA
jgi:hypothetical protein